MRLIDADVLKEEVNKKNVVGRFNTLLLIDNAPTVNTVKLEKSYFIKGFKEGCEYGKQCYERPKGEWIDNHIEGIAELHTCSRCKTELEVIAYKNFCPNCGAKMGPEEHYRKTEEVCMDETPENEFWFNCWTERGSENESSCNS